jgi:hypothetical protein
MTSKEKQRLEDDRIEQYIIDESYRVFNKYIETPNIVFHDQCVKLFVPFFKPLIYYLYDENSAKFLNTSVVGLIKERYKFLINESKPDTVLCNNM